MLESQVQPQSPVLCPLKICPEKYLHVYQLLHLIPEDLPTDNLYCPTALGSQTQQNHFWEFIIQTPAPMWKVTGVSNYSTVIGGKGWQLPKSLTLGEAATHKI